MLVPPDWQRAKKVDGLRGTPLSDFTAQAMAADHMRHFEIEQVRGVKPFTAREQPFLDGASAGGPEEYLQNRRRVDDNHRPSRIARIVCAGDSRTFTGSSSLSRTRTSAGVSWVLTCSSSAFR